MNGPNLTMERDVLIRFRVDHRDRNLRMLVPGVGTLAVFSFDQLASVLVEDPTSLTHFVAALGQAATGTNYDSYLHNEQPRMVAFVQPIAELGKHANELLKGCKPRQFARRADCLEPFLETFEITIESFLYYH